MAPAVSAASTATPGASSGMTGQFVADAETDAEAVLAAASQALFRLGRLFGRQPLQDVLTGRSGRAVELSRVLVVQAVADAAASSPGQDDGAGTARGEATVGMVAERLGVDPSTASRLVAETVADGYLTRATSTVDGRRACLALTDAGRALDAASRRFQREVFERATRDWSEADRQSFAHLFVRFAESVGASVTAQQAQNAAPDTASRHDRASETGREASHA